MIPESVSCFKLYKINKVNLSLPTEMLVHSGKVDSNKAYAKLSRIQVLFKAVVMMGSPRSFLKVLEK